MMIALETLSVSPDAIILSLGAVHFDPWGTGITKELYFRISVDEQDALNRTIDPNTLDWWSRQDPAIMEEAFSPDDRVPLLEAVDRFHKFAWGCKTFWSHGATFDLVMIEHLYHQLQKPLPWSYVQLRDTRTLFDLGVTPEMPRGGKHDALQDAIRQAVGVQNCYRKLNIPKQ